MSAYVLVLVLMGVYGVSTVSIDYPSKTLCDIEGKRVTQDLPSARYYCLERK